ncbi:unnamed protein product [Enterobius vermicularis]|uniref:RING-type domain-containing protein n=1 Tax=Enterobius vermicularis TaxID=51028 RepID=A0A0N4UUL7_ENTVE|nr:unnamed protein product [Enterobius vermicularis]
MCTEVAFFRSHDYAVADKSILDFLADADRSSLNIWIVFLGDCTKCPGIYFSLVSGRKIVQDGIHVESVLAECRNPKSSSLTGIGINKFDYLRLYMNFFPEDMKVHIRVKEGVAREVLHINAHNPLKEPLFLTLQSKEFFSSDSKTCQFALLFRKDFIKFLNALKEGRSIGVRNDAEWGKSSDFYLHPVCLFCVMAVFFQWQPPLCFSCVENRVQVVTQDCNHAMFCVKCYETYLARERERLGLLRSKNKIDKDSAFVRCPLCRDKIRSVGRIWFVTTRCLLCGCKTLDAVAGGVAGCGCVFGCYGEAQKLIRTQKPKCPYCETPLVDFDVAFCSSMVLFLTVFSISPTLELLRNSRFWKFGEIMSYSVRLELPGKVEDDADAGSTEDQQEFKGGLGCCRPRYSDSGSCI